MPSFIKFDGNAFTFKPKAGKVGEYLLTLKLTDDRADSLSADYHFRLTVEGASDTEEKGKSITEADDEEENKDNKEAEQDSGPV